MASRNDYTNAFRTAIRQYIPLPGATGTPFLPVLLDSAQKTVLTGTGADSDFAAQIIGKEIPIFVGGQALMGCRLCEGPFINTVAGEGFVDMIVTPARPAVPDADREIQSLRLNGTESFTSADGGATWTPIGTVFDDVEINVLYGTEDQTPFLSSIARYGSRAVPYRPHIAIELKNVPLALFGNVIPFVSAYIYQEDYITRNEALSRLAQYARYNADEYEFEVSGHDTFWIVIRETGFIEYVQDLQRSVGRNWNLVPRDKLYIFESPSTATPITLTRNDVIEDSVRFLQVDPASVPAVRNLGFIDTGRDNDFNKVKAVRSRFPIPLTSSQDTEDLDIPIGMEAIDAKAAVNESLLIDGIARDHVMFKAKPEWRGLGGGDIILPSFSAAVQWEAARIVTAAKNSADWTIDCEAERISLALLAKGPSITSNGGGATASITVDEEDGTAVTTVTADNEDATGAFSIIGGADASLFTINADTGVLTFLTEPDYEDPQDADANNTYVVIVQVAGDGLTDTQTITVTVSDVDDVAPTITSSNTASVPENDTLAKSLTANESVTWSIVGGADQARFEISGSTLRWLSNGVKNYEAPDDANTDNAYIVTVRATDGASNFTDQTITVTVTDVAEGPAGGTPIGLLLALTTP